jgi:transcriptional regulator with XRE-family HTH domain
MAMRGTARRRSAPNGGPDARARRDGVEVGRRLRELRHTRSLSLSELARRAGLSQGYLSQVERDRATPSTTALAKLSEVLGVPLGYLFEPGQERAPEHYVVRRSARRAVLYPGSRVRNELLVPDLRGRLEAVYFGAKAGMKSPLYTHEGEEFGYVLKGSMKVSVGNDTFVLHKGDSISFPSHHPHRWEALGRGVEALWIATPPSW